MPQIIVTAGDAADLNDGSLTLRERINASDFESDRFAANLLERLQWAVSDASEAERQTPTWEPEPQELRCTPELIEVERAPELVEA
jgi:hypothetical protein